MKKGYFLTGLLFTFSVFNSISFSQCSTQTLESSSCVCKDGSSDCMLLPDLNLSWFALDTYSAGPTEYSQTGNGVENGRLRITGSTPNIGHGSFTVRGSDFFVCGTDTVQGDPGICTDGTAPRQLIIQRVYSKNSNGTMTYIDRWAGAMTYHPTHGHNHVDDWVSFTLRIEDPSEPDPRNWPIVGNGAKIGFCLMDYGNCSYYNGHCKDDNTIYGQGNTMTDVDFPNYGLGGGSYGCSPVEQGISSGYTDIYSEFLDGMWIDIPPGTCNGDYWIVGQVDPNDNFLEEDETNNWTAIPFTLTQQEPAGNAQVGITSMDYPSICEGDVITLTATAALSYQWSNGETTQSIEVTQPGSYSVLATNQCGTGTSDPYTVTQNPTPDAPTVTGETVCVGEQANLTATGDQVVWYDENDFQVGTGNTFTTPSLMNSTMYYAQDVAGSIGTDVNLGKPNNTGNGAYFAGEEGLVFNALTPFTINSVKVYAEVAGDRDFMVLTNGGDLVQGGTFTLPQGESVVNLDFDIPAGSNYEMRVVGTITQMYRNSTGANYPYEIPGVLSITKSTSATAPLDYYYFFYDWDVNYGGSDCPSDMVEVEATVSCTVGLDEMDLTNQISVFPNPAKDQFNVQMNIHEKAANFKVEITDVLGKIVDSKTTSNSASIDMSFDCSKLDNGVYFVNIKVENKVYTKRIIIE